MTQADTMCQLPGPGEGKAKGNQQAGNVGLDLLNKVDHFVYQFRQNGKKHILRVPVPVPLETSVKEFAHRLINCHRIACYIEDDLIKSLDTFVKVKTKEKSNSMIHSIINSVQRKPEVINDLVGAWTASFTQEHRKYQHHTDNNVLDTEFSDMYHSLIHSPALETLLQLEHSYSVAVSDIVEQRDLVLKNLMEKQEQEMENLISQIGKTTTDSDVNNLSARQLEESQVQETKWSSQLSDLQEMQKREYREWVVTVHQNILASKSGKGIASFADYTKARSESTAASLSEEYQFVHREAIKMEESFTIHLGHQMKTMHNIRLICGDVLDLCRHETTFIGGNLVPQPQRLQTAMSLYSQALSAMILLVDDRIHSELGVKKDFRKICSHSTDFHFPDYDKQLSLTEQTLGPRAARARTLRTHSYIQSQGNPNIKSAARTSSNLLQTGDFYLTRHSNLAQVHVVFHLVTDESSSSVNINSRHPIIFGLRNILHNAARHNITTLTIPLLLVHEMAENITIQWCVKRAELIFKCVKGFMMETLSWDGDESRTIQFIVPDGISEDMFSTFTSMLPNIFRVSTPLDLSDVGRK